MFHRGNYIRRMKRLYSAWKEGKTECGEPFPPVDAIVIATGASDEHDHEAFTTQVWLFGFTLNDAIIILTKDACHILADKKEIGYLRQNIKNKSKSIVRFPELHVRNKKRNFGELIATLKASGKGKTLGIFVEDKFTGPFIESWIRTLKQYRFKNVDITNAFVSLQSIKEPQELALIKKGCEITVDVYYKYLLNQIVEIINSNKKVKHCDLADGVKNAITNKDFVGDKVNTAELLPAYQPIIQSGGHYSLEFSAKNDQRNLHFGVILCSLGVENQLYCSSISRTLLVNPSDTVQENYNFLVDLQEHLVTVLKSGSKLCDVYESGIQFTQKNNPEMIHKLTEDFGFTTGIDFRGTVFITPETTAYARKSQVYNLRVGLSNLFDEEADGENRNYSLVVGDIVIVNEQGPATVLTSTGSDKRLMMYWQPQPGMETD